MNKIVSLTCAMLLASVAHAEEELFLGTACYTQGAMKDVVDLSDYDAMLLDDGMLLMTQYLEDGKCAPVIFTSADWDAGTEIRDIGVKVAYASVYNWARGKETPQQLPPKQVMYFDAKADVTAE